MCLKQVDSLNAVLVQYQFFSVVGDANAAVEARVDKGWNKFRQLVPLLTNKDVSLLMRGKLLKLCALYVTWQRNVATEERTC